MQGVGRSARRSCHFLSVMRKPPFGAASSLYGSEARELQRGPLAAAGDAGQTFSSHLDRDLRRRGGARTSRCPDGGFAPGDLAPSLALGSQIRPTKTLKGISRRRTPWGGGKPRRYLCRKTACSENSFALRPPRSEQQGMTFHACGPGPPPGSRLRGGRGGVTKAAGTPRAAPSRSPQPPAFALSSRPAPLLPTPPSRSRSAPYALAPRPTLSPRAFHAPS